MKKLFTKLSKYILVYVMLYFVVFIITKNIINAMNMDFLKWVYVTSYSILSIGIILSCLQIIIKVKNKIVKVIVIAVEIFLLMIWGPIWIFKICLLHDKYEYIINTENKKIVAEVINFDQTNINYYEYINCFVKGTEIINSEYSPEGGSNPFEVNSD